MRKTRAAESSRSKRGNRRLPTFRNTEEFLALSDADKERIWESYNREIPLSETRPMTAAERKQWMRIQRKWREEEKAPKATKVISVSVERDLLERAEAYAKRYGLSRAALIAMGLTEFMRPSPSNGRSKSRS